jgi:hypothetical protein
MINACRRQSYAYGRQFVISILFLTPAGVNRRPQGVIATPRGVTYTPAGASVVSAGVILSFKNTNAAMIGLSMVYEGIDRTPKLCIVTNTGIERD